MRIVVDLDCTVFDFITPLIKEYNRTYGASLTVDKITDWGLPEGAKNVFSNSHFFRKLKPLPGAIEGVKQLISRGHEVILATSPSRDSGIACAKIDLVKKWLPELSENLCICERKDLFNADILIDDAPHFIEDFGRLGITICYGWPWNRGVGDYRTREGEHEQAWQTILDIVDSIQRGRDA